tara:strand:+ start:353 stop:559 length:207 start_codon:yes stop_codon:yes gene_type:complete
MQIELELESGVIVDINTYEWMSQNYSEDTIQWTLQQSANSGTLDGLLHRYLESKPLLPKSYSVLRLQY